MTSTILRRRAPCLHLAAAVIATATFLSASAGTGAGADQVSPTTWANGYNSRVRLMAGTDEAAPGRTLVAGVEIETKPDWKTYWRNPGESGVPPSFDWSKSTNVAAAKVLYPAPLRLVDKSGAAIGYLGRVLFPVAITPADPAKPVLLRLTVEYGVCKDICVPAQAELALDIAAGGAGAPPAELAGAMALVPRPRGQERAGDPVVKGIQVDLAGSSPRIVLDVAVPGRPEDTDAFLVAEDGGFVPMPVREPGGASGRVRFVVDLSSDVDLKDLKGKTLFATVTSGPGHASEATIRID